MIDDFFPPIPRLDIHGAKLDMSALFAEEGRLWSLVKPPLRRELEPHMRRINCYYSHLIEGFHTDPIDAEKSNLTVRSIKEAEALARAHLDIQTRLPEKLATGISPYSTEFICWLHQELLENVPEQFRYFGEGTRRRLVLPGRLRESDVAVGLHKPPTWGRLPNIMQRFQEVYGEYAGLQSIVAIAASHHRLVWIHPFLDGNGRVARLFTDALLSKAPFQAYGLWSISRGFALRHADYKKALARADDPRDHDADGRGPLSERALAEFCQYFISVLRDQITYMAGLLELDKMTTRLEVLARTKLDTTIREPAVHILRGAVLEGEFPRGAAMRISGVSERHARRVMSDLTARGWLVSDSEKGPLRLGLSLEVIEACFPGLYPQAYLARKVSEEFATKSEGRAEV